MSALPNEKLYERDFYAWAMEQAALLRAGQFTSLDIENIAEEMESMGRSENNQLINRLAVILTHLLKWQFQSSFQSRSWKLTIEEQRRRLRRHIKINPSLKGMLRDDIDEAYALALIEAERQTGMPRKTFAPQCPYTYDQMLDDDFWPES